jgi:hypothetical protein
MAASWASGHWGDEADGSAIPLRGHVLTDWSHWAQV